MPRDWKSNPRIPPRKRDFHLNVPPRTYRPFRCKPEGVSCWEALVLVGSLNQSMRGLINY